jgi:hypothetical protein
MSAVVEASWPMPLLPIVIGLVMSGLVVTTVFAAREVSARY